MTVLLNLPVLVTLAVISVLHLLSLALENVYGKIAIYVNIALHLALFILLLVLGATAAETVLAFMISVFVYTLLSFIFYKISGRDTR